MIMNTPKLFSLFLFFNVNLCVAADPLTLRMMVWDGYAPADKVKEFEDMKAKEGQPVKIVVTVVGANDDFYNAARRQSIELFTPTHNLIKDERYNYIKNNLIIPIDLANIPNFKDITPSLQKAEFIKEGDKIYAVPFVSGPYGLAYNKSKVSSPPDSWSALWDPQYHKKYKVVSDYPEVNIYITALALGYPITDWTDIKKLDNPTFKEKLRALAQNGAGYWSSVDKADDLAGLSIATSWGFSFVDLKKRGEIWEMASPKEGTPVWQDSFVLTQTLSDKPELKKVAEEWINFAISPQYQKDVAVKGLSSTPSNTKTQTVATPEEIAAYHLDDLEGLRKTQINHPTIDNVRTRNGIKILWDEAMKI